MTQSPLTSTVGDFWRMVWEQRAESVVVMATEEEGRWWPQGQGASQRHSLVIGRSWAEGISIIIRVVDWERFNVRKNYRAFMIMHYPMYTLLMYYCFTHAMINSVAVGTPI